MRHALDWRDRAPGSRMEEKEEDEMEVILNVYLSSWLS